MKRTNWRVQKEASHEDSVIRMRLKSVRTLIK